MTGYLSAPGYRFFTQIILEMYIVLGRVITLLSCLFKRLLLYNYVVGFYTSPSVYFAVNTAHCSNGYACPNNKRNRSVHDLIASRLHVLRTCMSYQWDNQGQAGQDIITLNLHDIYTGKRNVHIICESEKQSLPFWIWKQKTSRPHYKLSKVCTEWSTTEDALLNIQLQFFYTYSRWLDNILLQIMSRFNCMESTYT